MSVRSWFGQYCVNVSDLDASVALYEALGLTCTSRTEIPQAFEAIVENPGGGSKLQLAQQKDEPFSLGNALWKLYVNTHDVAATFSAATDAGCRPVSEPERLDRWPVTVAFVHDRDGHLVELVERHPWPDDAPPGAWMGQYCINVTDIDETIGFYETAGLTCTSRTEIPQAFEAIVENPDTGSKLQLAQQKDDPAPIEMGSFWKLYINTDDCATLHDALVEAGHRSVLEPMSPERWPVTIAFVNDPDGYLVELVERHPD
ncbi:MAG: VOC family protein [Acidimicrobiales bacterium]|nr:VOC family protein [Acidimicrobiales bacterium]